MIVGPRILLIGGTYRALCVLERLLDRGERIVAFLGEEGSGDHDFCPEILEVCDRAGVPARSVRKLGEEVVRWLEDRIRPDLAVSVGLRGEIPLSIGGNCRLGLLEAVEVHDSGPRPIIALRHQGREVARRELDVPKEDEPAGQLFVRVTEELLDLVECQLAQIGRAHSRPQIRVAHELALVRTAPDVSADRPQLEAATEALEREAAARIGAARALAMPSSAEAAHALCRALRIGAGDEVMIPALASAGVLRGLERSGARVVLADIEPRSLTIDLQSVRERLSSATRALVVSHGFGYCAAQQPLAELARDAGIALIEDCGVGFGSRGDSGYLGAGANPCIFEMQEVAGEPGGAPALLTWPAQLGEPAAAARLGPGALALLSSALRETDVRIAARARNAGFYDRELARYDAFRVRGAVPGRTRCFVCYPLGVTNAARTCAEDLHGLLHELGIETRLLAALASDRVLGELPAAARACESTLLLPIHAGLTESMCEAVLDALYDYAIG